MRATIPRTESNPVELGLRAPDFQLPDAGGRLHGPADHADAPALLVAFISNRCPFVVGIRDELRRLRPRQRPAGPPGDRDQHQRRRGASRGDAGAASAQEAAAFGYGFPYLKDDSQDVARAYGAACTPDLFLFDADRRLAYHGQFDGFRPGNGVTPTGANLQAALDAVLAGEPPLARQIPSIGCNIKWRPEATTAVAAE